MIVQGLRYWVFWLAQTIICVLAQIVICAGGVGLLYALRLLQTSNALLVWFLFFTFAISLLMIAFTISIFFNKARTAGGVAQMFVVIGAAPFIALQYLLVS